MNDLRDSVSKFHGDRGQAIILFVGIFTVIMVIGAIVVDFGLWVSERRGAQKDADAATMAGTYELLDDSVTVALAEDAANLWAARNGIDPVDDVHNLAVRSLAFEDGWQDQDDYCHDAPDTGGRLNAVVLDADHDTRSLFAEFFGVLAPEIGAHACGRAGSLLSTIGLRPWSVSMFNTPCFDWNDDGDGVQEADDDQFPPQYGENCVFRLESPSSQVGSLRLGDEVGDECSPPGGGANTYRENIIEGADAECSVGEDVATQPGLATGPTLTAVRTLLSSEGDCDEENPDPLDGIDQFGESFTPTSGVPGPDETFVPRNCVTPREIHIVIIPEFSASTGFETVAIEGFAVFFIEGCEEVDADGNVVDFSATCDIQGGAQADFQIRGFFMNIVETEGTIGDFDEFGTKGTRLVE